MLKNRLLVLLISLPFLFVYSCKNPSVKKAEKEVNNTFIYQDEKPDSLSASGIVELQIPSSGSKIFGFAYLANGKRLHPTVILLHGMPGNERNLDIAQNLRRGGYNVIYFDYRGNWGSEGKYLFSNCIEDARAVVNFIADSANRERLKVDTSRIALIGHSMGAGVAFIDGINNDRVKAVAGISLFNPYSALQGASGPGTLQGIGDYISTLGMLNTEPDIFLRDMVSKIDQYNIQKMIANTEKPLLVIDEHKNNDYLSDYSKKKTLTYKIWDTDHAFTNRRNALSIELKTWLDKNLK